MSRTEPDSPTLVVINPIRTSSLRKEPEFIRTERIIERQPVVVPIRIEEKQKSNEQPTQKSKPGKIEEQIERKPGSKKDFEIEPESKKDFELSKTKFEKPSSNSKSQEPEGDLEFDRDSGEGRWRYDWQVAELVIYRNEFGLWPSDVPVETGLRSYYELRYFDEGTNRKGERYAELYAKHRAKRDLWLKQASPSVAMDIAAAESNVVPMRRRQGRSS